MPSIIQAFLDLGEVLISSDTGAALDAFKTVSASVLLIAILSKLSI